VKYAFIRDHAKSYKIQSLCEMMEVSRSAYYDWLDRPESDRSKDDRKLAGELTALHFEMRQAYGTLRLWHELARRQRPAGKHRIARLKRELSLWTRRRRRFVRGMASRRDRAQHPNILDRQFSVDQQQTVWVADVTAIWTIQGWLYLAVVMDLRTRRIIGWSTARTFDAPLTIAALDHALRRRTSNKPLLHHSDRGVHYGCRAYQLRLQECGITPSMSRVANCYDNAVAESFFSSLKNEETLHHRFHTREEACAVIDDYIEMFYNRKRLHSTLGYITPAEFAQKRRVA
jgi:transposase InsO family protein